MHPEVFGDYLLVGLLDSTQMSEVLLGVLLGDRSGKLVVIKRAPLGVPASGKQAQALLREAEVLREVQGAGVVQCDGSGEVGGLPFMALEYIRGISLDRLIAQKGGLSAEAARAVGLDLARALGAIHAAGWVHGDLAPSNVLIDEAGEVRLIDFGVAARAGSTRRDTAGKPGYIAPEVARGVAADPAQDVYGWGTIVGECLAGRRLFVEKDLAQAPARETSPLVAKVSAVLPVVEKALAHSPSARPTAADLVRACLQGTIDRSALLPGVEVSSPKAVAGQQSKRPPLTIPEVSPCPAAVAVREVSDTIPEEGDNSLSSIPSYREGAAVGTPLAPQLQAHRPLAAPAPAAVAASARGDKAVVAPPVLLPWRWVAVMGIGLVLAFGLGGALGRLSARMKSGSVAVLGGLPRKTEVQIDGRPVRLPADGSPFPVTAGKHTVTVILPKGEHRDYQVVVKPGERIVVVPLGKSANPVDPVEDR